MTLSGPCRLCQALLSAPPPLVGVWPVVRPLFLFFSLSGFARFGLGVLLLVFSLLPFLFCVPPLVFRLSNCHLIFIVISFPFSFHFHLHLIRRGLKKPRGSGACVWTIWIDVKLLIFQFTKAGASGPSYLPDATKLWYDRGRVNWSFTCTCRSWHGCRGHSLQDHLDNLIYFRWWHPAKPRTGTSFFQAIFKPNLMSGR